MNPLLDPRAKALIFDIDGTLADTMAVHYKACQIVCNREGFDFPYDYFLAKAGIPTLKTFRMLVKEFGFKADPDQLAHDKDQMFFELLPEIKPMPLVSDLAIEQFGKLPMGLGTGGSREMADKIVTILKMKELFPVIITFEDVKNPKPAPDTFLLCAERLGITPENCQVFEDAEMGLQAGRTAGMITTDVRPFLTKV